MSDDSSLHVFSYLMCYIFSMKTYGAGIGDI